jgi:N-acetylglutamate synthase-like GNAT family acetyltransferase
MAQNLLNKVVFFIIFVDMFRGDIKVMPALESEMVFIGQFAKKLDLDCEDLNRNQFIVAKKDEKIIGFGRLRKYPECVEIATVGVIDEEQKNGVGSVIVRELIQSGPSEIFVTCVIPDFFKKLGFQLVKQYPSALQKKVDFCKSYDFSDEQIFVMVLKK